MAEKATESKRVGAVYQAAAFLVSALCLTFVLGIRYKTFISHDPVETVQPNIADSNQITTGLHVAHFNKFQVSHNKFQLHGTLWFAYNPKIVSLETIKEFTIFNGQILTKSKPRVSEFHDKTVVQFRVHFSFYCPLNYRMFPFDDHRIVVIITNNFLPDGVTFKSSTKDVTINPQLYLPGWKIENHLVETGYHQVVLESKTQEAFDTQQETVITFLAERDDPSIAINIILTLMLLLFMSLLTFSSDEDSVLIVMVAMVALIGYRVVMQTMGPSHISYFMFTDYLYLFTLVGSILTLFGGILTRERKSSVTEKKLIIAGIYFMFVVSCSIMSFIL